MNVKYTKTGQWFLYSENGELLNNGEVLREMGEWATGDVPPTGSPWFNTRQELTDWIILNRNPS